MSDSAKRRRLHTAVAAPTLSTQRLSVLLTSLGDNVSRWTLRHDIDKAVDISTDYGKVIVDVDVGTSSWSYINPFALVWLLCSRSQGFARFLRQCYDSSEDCVRRLALYTDEATPGNQQRPDNSRQTQCIYWCMLFLPHWFRRRRLGWLVFGVMRTQTQKKMEAQLSGLFKLIVQVFSLPSRPLVLPMRTSRRRHQERTQAWK